MDDRNYDIENYYTGDSVSLPLSFTDNAGSVIDLTGYTFYFTLKYDEKDADVDAILQVIVHPGDIFNPTQGVITLAFETEDIPPKTYFYDVRYKKPDNTVATALNGKFYLKSSITQTT